MAVTGQLSDILMNDACEPPSGLPVSVPGRPIRLAVQWVSEGLAGPRRAAVRSMISRKSAGTKHTEPKGLPDPVLNRGA